MSATLSARASHCASTSSEDAATSSVRIRCTDSIATSGSKDCCASVTYNAVACRLGDTEAFTERRWLTVARKFGAPSRKPVNSLHDLKFAEYG